jgi:hypothetical protein
LPGGQRSADDARAGSTTPGISPRHIEVLPAAREPFILHHHARFDDWLFLKAAAPSAADAARRANAAIALFQSKRLVSA